MPGPESGYRFDDPEVAPERDTVELHEQPVDETASLEDRLLAGEVKWLGNYPTDIPEMRTAVDETLADMRERYGTDEVVISAAFDEEAGKITALSGQLGVYVAAEAFEAVEAKK